MGIRFAIAVLALAGWMASVSAQAQVVQGGLELRWGDPAPGPGDRRGPAKFQAALVLDGGARIPLDPDQARRGAGDLYALANRRVAVQFSGAKSSAGGRRIEAIVPADTPDSARAHGLTGKSDGVAKATLGATRWVTVACRFSDIAEEQKPVGFFRDQYGEGAGELGHYWREVSYDGIQLTGSDAYGWFALPHPRSHYVTEEDGEDGEDEADLTALFNDCTAAADAEVDFSQVVGINLMFNANLDGYAWGGGRCTTLDGADRCWSSTWNPPWSFNNLAPLAHEMGHGYGLPHSDNSDGDDDTYDNPWDVMSDSWSNAVVDTTYGARPKHINILQRDRLGWVDAVHKRTIAAGSARTRLAVDYASLPLPTEDNGLADNIRMLVLQTPQSPDPYRGTFYTIEARRPTGDYEGALAGDAIIIHQVGSDYRYEAESQDSDSPPADRADNEGSMFKVGESWTSPDHLFNVLVESKTATGFVVVVGGRPRQTGGRGPRRSR
ncbi:hypothetical protein FZO89_05970 [Luteimonas viscosa]|uniref:M6 family metalloprotease domain-containing protein n=1 Tax=Luteimonas viscosa TaxID=1132694 RepID=A0A5D4XMG5_9GAMM|nr:M12 family metallo-peptidase [Luteimonas viscosa]TYT25836.1 hypothetical protein FZO89_05970 [Luteimonas viscosa]